MSQICCRAGENAWPDRCPWHEAPIEAGGMLLNTAYAEATRRMIEDAERTAHYANPASSFAIRDAPEALRAEGSTLLEITLICPRCGQDVILPSVLCYPELVTNAGGSRLRLAMLDLPSVPHVCTNSWEQLELPPATTEESDERDAGR